MSYAPEIILGVLALACFAATVREYRAGARRNAETDARERGRS
jgi:hypothetical protein